MWIYYYLDPNGTSLISVTYVLAYSAKNALMSASNINRPTTPVDSDPTLTFEMNGQKHFSQMARISKRPTTSITTQVTP